MILRFDLFVEPLKIAIMHYISQTGTRLAAAKEGPVRGAHPTVLETIKNYDDVLRACAPRPSRATRVPNRDRVHLTGRIVRG